MSDLTPQDEELLSLARGADLPSADDHARVKRKLLARVGVGVAAGASALSASGTASAGLAGAGGAGTLALAAKIVTALVVVGAAGSAGWVLTHRSGHSASGAQRVGPVATQAVAAVRPKPLATAASNAVPIPSDTAAVAGFAPVATVAPDLRTNPSRATPPAQPAASSAPAVATFAPIAPPSAAASSKPAPPPVGPSTVAAEAALLRRADAARKAGNPALALALLNQHRARFPNGVLAEEREAERVTVLCALGRTAQAQAAAASFLRAYPHSPLAVRVRASCAGP